MEHEQASLAVAHYDLAMQTAAGGVEPMLKITINTNRRIVTLKLEGKLAGPWVPELERVWQAALTDPACKSIVVELCDVTFIDAEARDLLARVYCRGARFKTAGFMVKSIMEEIKQECDGAPDGLLQEARYLADGSVVNHHRQ
jgi:anti-anti-sigma factor